MHLTFQIATALALALGDVLVLQQYTSFPSANGKKSHYPKLILMHHMIGGFVVLALGALSLALYQAGPSFLETSQQWDRDFGGKLIKHGGGMSSHLFNHPNKPNSFGTIGSLAESNDGSHQVHVLLIRGKRVRARVMRSCIKVLI
jgi:hypothetical protein